MTSNLPNMRFRRLAILLVFGCLKVMNNHSKLVFWRPGAGVFPLGAAQGHFRRTCGRFGLRGARSLPECSWDGCLGKQGSEKTNLCSQFIPGSEIESLFKARARIPLGHALCLWVCAAVSAKTRPKSMTKSIRIGG